jgi:hypothetical protein
MRFFSHPLDDRSTLCVGTISPVDTRGVTADAFPAKAGPTEGTAYPCGTGFSREAFDPL